jgi:hypothetical protein
LEYTKEWIFLFLYVASCCAILTIYIYDTSRKPGEHYTTKKTLRIQRNNTTIATQEIWSREKSSIIGKEIKKEEKRKHGIINIRKRKVHSYKSNEKKQ